jgi:hypothetical protein
MKWLSASLLLFLCSIAHSASSGPDHAIWDSIVKKYVSADARVDYGRLKKEGVPELDRYLEGVAAKWPDSMSQNARRAAYINAYNALTVRWIVTHYPIASIWRTKQPFTGVRHTVDGRKMSLDGVEKWLRDTGDPRVHAVLVCASIGCPPLRREAYVEQRLDAQMDDNARAWLANREQNDFDAARRTATVSRIFYWYKGDFTKNGGSVNAFLAKYSPQYNEFVKQPNAILRFKRYHWGLNDTAGIGDNYSHASYAIDAARSK